jgi:hypothetical protein
MLNVHVADDLKERLVAEAAERDASLNDLAVGILADHFTVAFSGTGRRSPGASTSGGPLQLAVPYALWRKIDVAAGRMPKGQRSKVAVVQSVFRDHFALLDRPQAA